MQKCRRHELTIAFLCLDYFSCAIILCRVTAARLQCSQYAKQLNINGRLGATIVRRSIECTVVSWGFEQFVCNPRRPSGLFTAKLDSTDDYNYNNSRSSSRIFTAKLDPGDNHDYNNSRGSSWVFAAKLNSADDHNYNNSRGSASLFAAKLDSADNHNYNNSRSSTSLFAEYPVKQHINLRPSFHRAPSLRSNLCLYCWLRCLPDWRRDLLLPNSSFANFIC